MPLSVSFFLGLVLTLTALGTTAAVVGRLLAGWKAAFALGAAGVTLGGGIAALIGPAFRRWLPAPKVRQRGGVIGAFSYGLLYSLATITTSAGPLVLLLTLAAAMGRPPYGAALSLSYGMGRGLPFLALGILAGRAAEWLEPLNRARRTAEVVSGVALLGLSAYFVRFALGSR